MSSRERWIVYPLLVLAMSLGAKDQIFERPLKVSRVECRDLTVTRNLNATSIQGQLIEAGQLKAHGELEANYCKADAIHSEKIDCTHFRASAYRTALVDCDQILCKRLAATTKDGKKSVEIIGETPVQAGGMVIYGPGGKPAVMLTADKETGIVRVVNTAGGGLQLRRAPRQGRLLLTDEKGAVVWERLYPSSEDRDPNEKPVPEKEPEE